MFQDYVLDPKTHSEKKALTTLSWRATNHEDDYSVSIHLLAVAVKVGWRFRLAQDFLRLRNKTLSVSVSDSKPLLRHIYERCSKRAVPQVIAVKWELVSALSVALYATEFSFFDVFQ